MSMVERYETVARVIRVDGKQLVLETEFGDVGTIPQSAVLEGDFHNLGTDDLEHVEGMEGTLVIPEELAIAKGWE